MVPSISTPVTPRILPLGAAVAIQLAASNEPTAWLASLPAGLEIDSSGLIFGIPTTAGITSSSITAANADGSSAAVTIQFVVADNVPGLSEGNPFAQPVNWELQTGELTLAGLTATDPLLSWTAGETKVVSFGISQGGILGEPGVNLLQLTLKKELDEPGIEITDDSANVTVTGSGVTARHEVAITIPATGQVATWLGDGEQSDQINYFDGYIEALAQAVPESFSANGTGNASLGSWAAGQTKNNTLHLALPEASASYTITASLVCAGDTALQHTFTIASTVTWNGSSFSHSGSLPAAEVNYGTDPAAMAANASHGYTWDANLTVQSITGNATGIAIALRAVSTARKYSWGIGIYDGDLTVNGDATLTIAGGPKNVDLKEASTIICSFSVDTGDTPAGVRSAVTAALVGTTYEGTLEAVYFDSALNNFILFFNNTFLGLDGYDFDTHGSGGGTGTLTAAPDRTLTGTTWAVSIAAEAAETATRISRNTPVRIARHL